MAEGAYEPNFEHEAATKRLQGLVLEEGKRLAREYERNLVYGKQDSSTNPKDLHGVKKPPLGLVPPAALILTAKAMQHGAEKYGPYNWREKAVRNTVYIDAAMRHLMRYLDGEDVDTDSGVPHVAHVAACMSILMDATEFGNLRDDRPIAGPASRLIHDLTEQDDK